MVERKMVKSYESLNDAPLNALKKGDTEIWYQKDYDPERVNNICKNPKRFKPDLKRDYILLGKIKSKNLDEIYWVMQGEVWSPEGQANNLIKKLGLSHTSMMVGDCIVMDGKTYMVCDVGFAETKKKLRFAIIE